MERKIILTLILVVSALGLSAQTGLNINQFFSEPYPSNPAVTIISMQMENKGVSKYRSISVSDEPQIADKIAASVRKDGAASIEKEQTFRKGQLYFGFYTLPKRKGLNRYILYLNRRPAGSEKTTLIYIEGVLDEKDVKKMIN